MPEVAQRPIGGMPDRQVSLEMDGAIILVDDADDKSVNVVSPSNSKIRCPYTSKYTTFEIVVLCVASPKLRVSNGGGIVNLIST